MLLLGPPKEEGKEEESEQGENADLQARRQRDGNVAPKQSMVSCLVFDQKQSKPRLRRVICRLSFRLFSSFSLHFFFIS